jgi:hypothetical protein
LDIESRKYDSKGHSEAICWMLPHMLSNLLCYEDVLFLDSMKKSSMILPDRTSYIGPKVKDGEMEIHQVAKCIGIEENLDVYQFVLQSLASIELQWSLKKLQIIFANQFFLNQHPFGELGNRADLYFPIRLSSHCQ